MQILVEIFSIIQKYLHLKFYCIKIINKSQSTVYTIYQSIPLVEFDWVIGRLGDEHIQLAGSDVTTCSEVFSGLNVDESCLEFYDVNNGMGGNTDSTVINDSMSVEIELAMEKAGIGMYYAKEEEFNLELLDTWNNIIIEGVYCVMHVIGYCMCVMHKVVINVLIEQSLVYCLMQQSLF